MPHPTVQILLWLCLTVALQALHATALLSICTLLTAVALIFSSTRFYILLRRTRWVMLSLLLIYAYATPGEAVFTQWGTFSPTDEGLLDGLLQLGRLLCALAALSILLTRLNQQQLIAGLYALAYPLRFFGLSRERIAVRLALTLRYADSAMLNTASDWHSSMENMLAPVEAKRDSIELHAAPITLRDALLLALTACASLALMLL
ncbi:MAG: hypothetical protein HY306_03715 [Nitrosomonadales bacterium]|nr:hypothetical protein [Nitrosomonadales bacterium]